MSVFSGGCDRKNKTWWSHLLSMLHVSAGRAVFRSFQFPVRTLNHERRLFMFGNILLSGCSWQQHWRNVWLLLSVLWRQPPVFSKSQQAIVFWSFPCSFMFNMQKFCLFFGVHYCWQHVPISVPSFLFCSWLSHFFVTLDLALLNLCKFFSLFIYSYFVS